MAKYSKTSLVKSARFSEQEIELINQSRRPYNRLGIAYQIAFVKLRNQLPTQTPFEVIEDILDYAAIQLELDSELIKDYDKRQATISDHQDKIRLFFGLSRFSEADPKIIEKFIFEQACQLEQTHALQALVKDYLKKQSILEPALSTLNRLIQTERQKARDFIFEKIYGLLSDDHKTHLDKLLDAANSPYSALHTLKQTSHRASAEAILKIVEKLDRVKTTGVLDIDLSWLNNNLQRWMWRYVRKATASRLRELKPKKCFSLLVCFLQQQHQNLVDDLVRTYDKVISQTYNRTQIDLDINNRSEQKNVKSSLTSFRFIADAILNESIEDSELRKNIFQQIPKDDLSSQRNQTDQWLTGKYKDVFTLLVNTRFTYLRRFTPTLLEHLPIEKEETTKDSLIQAVTLMKQMNQLGKRTLDETTPLDFMPKSIQNLVVEDDGNINKQAWECALLTAVRDNIKLGNIAITNSKRYGRIDNFLMPVELWEERRQDFFQRAGLPEKSIEVTEFLRSRLNQVFDKFLQKLPNNTYARLGEEGWQISKDETEELTTEKVSELEKIKKYLAKHMRIIKLPELLIQVDNELQFSRNFMNPKRQKKPNAGDICGVIAAVMAEGCNIGHYTMSHLIEGVSYHRIKNISDWFLTEETQRSALAVLVTAISKLDITKHWGSGKTSSSDGQRFSWRQKVLQQSYSPKFNDFALEFYTFIADNYAPFYSTPIECTDRDAPYVLDGLLYNESDLQIEEHFTDTHGYTEINFAAFAMLGKTFSPRIRGMHKQNIYRIDKTKDYGALEILVNKPKRTIQINSIVEQWDRIGHFYASLESGYVTASTALKRLNGYSGKNHLYKANRELGRIFKTEHILKYMSNRKLRSNSTRGLLKGEELHQLARDLKYAKRGRITVRDWLEQKNSGSCLTLIIACIIYWQAKEIHRVLLECPTEESLEIDLKLLKHISPITWDNVIVYGEYIINKDWIKL